MNRAGSIEKSINEQRLEEGREYARWISEGKSFPGRNTV